MMPPYTTDKPWVAVVTVNEFLTFFASDKERDIRSFEIVVLGREIVASDQRKTNDGMLLQESKYDNVDFLPALNPGAAAMEFLSTDRDTFEQFYVGQLTNSSKAIIAMTSIADMVVNDKVSVLMICHSIDQKEWINILINTFDDQFELKVATMVDLLDPEYDPLDIGPVDRIKERIEDVKNQLKARKDTTAFFNQLTDSYVLALRESLEKESIETLREYADQVGVWLDRRSRSDKSALIDTLIRYSVF